MRTKHGHGSGSVRFRAGAWRVQVYSGRKDDGRPRFEYRTVAAPNTATGRRKAEGVARDIYDSVQRRAAPPGSLAELVDRWVEHREHEWAPRSANETRSALTRHVLDTLGSTPLDRLTARDIDACYARLRRRGLSAGSVRRIHIMVHAALAQAVRWGDLDRNPADQVQPPRYDAPEAAHLPSPEVVRAAIVAAAPNPALAVIIRLGLHTGARRGELVALRWSDIDMDDRAMRIWQSKTRKPKFLAVGARTAAGLSWWREMVDEQHRAIRGRPMPDDWWVFPSPRLPDKHLGESAVSHGWDRLHVDGLLFKSLRKTMSTVLLTNGYDVRTVMGRGGWSASSVAPGAAVMLTHYAQFVSSVDRAAAETLDDWLDG